MRTVEQIVNLVIVMAISALPAAALEARVLNGGAATEDVPWMVSLTSTVDGPGLGHRCGGVLIDPTTVLTAAHCLTDAATDPASLSVVVGRKRLTDSVGEVIPVEGVIPHPDYDDIALRNDIGLVKLAEPAKVSTFAVVGNSADEAAARLQAVTLYGWGVIFGDVPVRPSDLQKAELPLIDDAACSARLGLDFDPRSMMCAGKLATTLESEDGVDACSGDSGGPLVSYDNGTPKVVGLVSWGYACGSSKVWGVYTKVALFADWIASRPQVKPYPVSGVTIQGTPAAGQTLTCVAGEWGGSQPLKLTYEWIDSQTGPLPGKTSAKLKLGTKDVGRALSCVAKATNPGGTTEAVSPEIPAVFPRSQALGRSKAARRIAGSWCVGQNCRALVTFDAPVKKSRALLVRGSSRRVLNAPVQPTSTTVELKYRRNQGGTFYVRVLLDTGRTELVTVELAQ